MGNTYIDVTIRNPAEPLLGMTTLESGGFVVDPRSETLKRLKGVRLGYFTPYSLLTPVPLQTLPDSARPC